MLLDSCFNNENMSGACVYISTVNISTAIHILACVAINFAKMSKPEGPQIESTIRCYPWLLKAEFIILSMNNAILLTLVHTRCEYRAAVQS